MLQKIIDSVFVQRVLAKVQLYALKGMNYANSGDYKQSGELSVLKYISNLNKNNEGVVFDVGGNHGGYTNAVSTMFSDKITIHAFEPSVKTFDIFKRNTGSVSNLVPNNTGMGESVSTLTLYSNSDGSGLASVYDRKIEHYGIRLDQKETIQISTVDIYCKQQGIDSILLLKLDIEGHELSAIKGASEMIKGRKVKYIQFECGGTNIDSRTYFKDFFDLLSPDYKIYRILKNGLFEIKRYNELYEVFLSVNYLAELKTV